MEIMEELGHFNEKQGYFERRGKMIDLLNKVMGIIEKVKEEHPEPDQFEKKLGELLPGKQLTGTISNKALEAVKGKKFKFKHVEKELRRMM